MKFLRINPAEETVAIVEGNEVDAAAPDLFARGVDHGLISRNSATGRGVGLFVWENGLIEGDGPYFALGRQLYSGDAIVYAFDGAGETIDMPHSLISGPTSLKPLWLKNRDEVELAIVAGMVDRPKTTVNGALVWQWNQRGPFE